MVSKLTVHAYDWIIKDEYTDDGGLAIHAWCLDRESKPYLLRVESFPAFCHIELPTFVNGKHFEWNSGRINAFAENLNRMLKDDAPLKLSFKQAKKTYYYRGERRYPMLLAQFKTLNAMQHCERILSRPISINGIGQVMANVWETNINSIRKLLTIKNLRYSQWFEVEGQLIDRENPYRISKIDNEYIIDWDKIVPLAADKTKGWVTKPGILGIDIECYSNNHNAMPNKYHDLHVAYMISCVYQRSGDKSSRRRVGIIYGDCDQIPESELSNTEVIQVKSEIEMVDKLGEVINRFDPEIITGYNILSFDYPYLDFRIARRLHAWPVMGRLISEVPTMSSKQWKSGAYGYQSINILNMAGRISIDLLPIVKRDYKLDKYDLNTVAGHFLDKSKHPIEAKEMFEIYERLSRAKLKWLAVHEENPSIAASMKDEYDAICKELREKIESTPAYLPELLKERRAQMAQEVGDEFKFHREAMTKVMRYCIQDSELVVDLLETLNIWVGLIELSNIVGTTIVELFTRGQQIRCISQLYDLASRLGFVLDRREVHGKKFKGGAVYDPIPGLYENILCFDFASLYPSIIRAYNICFTTLLTPELADQIPDDQCHVCEFDQDEEGDDDDEDEDDEDEDVAAPEQPAAKKPGKKDNITKTHYKFKYIKSQEGLLPQLVRSLVDERKAVNGQILAINAEIKALLADPTSPETLERIKALSTDPTSQEGWARIKLLSDKLAVATDDTTRGKINDELKLWKANPADPKIVAEIASWSANPADPEIKTRVAQLKLQAVVLDKRQLALKVSANSFFGFLGVHEGGKMPLREGAMSITAMGRQLIGVVNKFLKDKYGAEIIYGDTDSTMVDLHIKEQNKVNAMGKRLSEEISGKPAVLDANGKVISPAIEGLFPGRPTLKMEFEKGMKVFLTIKKKNYIAVLIDDDGSIKMKDVKDKSGKVIGKEPSLLVKGVPLARRDKAKWMKTVYTDIVRLMAIERKPLYDVIEILIKHVAELMNGKVDHKQLSVIRELGANYKKDTYFMKIYSDYLRSIGKIVNPGDRLEYLVVVDESSKYFGNKLRLPETYLESQKTDKPLMINYMYYLEKVLMKQIDQLISVGYKNEIAKFDYIGFKPTGRSNFVGLNTPVKLMIKMLEKGINLNMILEGLKAPAPVVEIPQVVAKPKLVLKIIDG